MQKPLYVFDFSKVITVRVSTCTSIRNFFRVHQNRTTGADFVINTAYLSRILGVCEISDIPPQAGELYDNSSK